MKMEQFIEDAFKLRLSGLPFSAIIIAFKNCLEFDMKLFSSKRSHWLNTLFLFAIAFGGQILSAVFLDQQPKFMVTDGQTIAYGVACVFTFIIARKIQGLAQFLYNPVYLLWIFFKIAGAVMAAQALPSNISQFGRLLSLVFTLMGGTLVLLLVSQTDSLVHKTLWPNIGQVFALNSSLAIIILLLSNFIRTDMLIACLWAYHYFFANLYKMLQGSAKTSRKIKSK